MIAVPSLMQHASWDLLHETEPLWIQGWFFCTIFTYFSWNVKLVLFSVLTLAALYTYFTTSIHLSAFVATPGRGEVQNLL